jgi:transposase-like protein
MMPALYTWSYSVDGQYSPVQMASLEAEIIQLCLRWYLRYALSYRDLEEMMPEWGLHVDHTTIHRSRVLLRSRTRKMLSAASESLQRLLESG